LSRPPEKSKNKKSCTAPHSQKTARFSHTSLLSSSPLSSANSKILKPAQLWSDYCMQEASGTRSPIPFSAVLFLHLIFLSYPKA